MRDRIASTDHHSRFPTPSAVLRARVPQDPNRRAHYRKCDISDGEMIDTKRFKGAVMSQTL
jgi:hypothetical protein